MKNYKDLKIWQESYQLCLDVYKIEPLAKVPKVVTPTKLVLEWFYRGVGVQN